ncbi:thioredoxin family protein [Dinoroseobacter sp. S76]|uniref:thioredoxin family protein n=1 Tax=Dinoroseobacter sp. S76 TaxID=3415124 RepID=UPI003C7EAFA2
MPRLAILLSLLLLLVAPLAVRAQSLELVMVEQTGCHWCAAWHAEIGPAYPKTAEGQAAPLRMVDLRALPEDLDLVSRPRFTPTFILVSDGQELARLEGYPGQDFFWPVLAQMLETAQNNALEEAAK